MMRLAASYPKTIWQATSYDSEDFTGVYLVFFFVSFCPGFQILLLLLVSSTTIRNLRHIPLFPQRSRMPLVRNAVGSALREDFHPERGPDRDRERVS